MGAIKPASSAGLPVRPRLQKLSALGWKCGGFNCTAGWDPMTGLGTPNFAVLAKLALEGF